LKYALVKNGCQRPRLAALRAGQTSQPAGRQASAGLAELLFTSAKLQKMIRITNDDKPYSSAVLRQAIVGRCPF